MLETFIPKSEWKVFADEMIHREHLYNNETGDYGLEKEPHITLLYGLHNGTDLDALKKLLPPLNTIKINLTYIGKFKNEKYDVLKFDVDSKKCHTINSILCNNFEYTSDYDEYYPHMTIAYLKKGYADNYCSAVPFNMNVQAKQYWFNDTKKDTRFKI